MGMESQGLLRPAGNLTPNQVQTFQKVEPKALGSIQIIIAVLCLCLSITILQLYEEVHFSPDLIVVVVIVVQLLVSGSILIHAGRFPSLFWVKATLVSHLVSAAFSTAVLMLLSRHLPYRQDTYHCEHCRRLEIYAVLPGFRQRAAPSRPEVSTPSQPQVEVMVPEVEPMPEREPEPRSEPTDEIPSPPTEPQVAPIDSLTDV
ncbi:uncharacterized protein LOC132104464 isoform X3 [Carassius carassius]|uniref:uncharacterized protein LOC132104464 isoform X3 n=1 Tax=Carassius carassius TaxID=217509 RepID=UPI0028685FB3|nr:uncharacterized protein LOC132104464 isoform X3 [Carassius carassius]